MRRRRLVALGTLAVAFGALCWGWGHLGVPGRAVVRGHLGDVAATALVYAVIGAAFLAPRWVCAAGAALIAVSIEMAQRAAPTSASVARELVLGAHFDPWDLVAYVGGIGLAWLWDRDPG